MTAEDKVEKVVIIGSGPAGWTAGIYAARANLNPLVFEGNPLWPENQTNGTMPLGQLALPTERQPYWVQANKPQPGHGINGPEMMELMRQQAVNFGTRIVSDDIVA